MLLAVEGLGKRFANRWIFRGISFELSVGQRLVILGPNGSGKSTLLKTIAGLIPATEGSVKIAEKNERRSLGASAIDLAVYPHLTVSEHLELAGELRGCEPRTAELLEFVNLDYARDRFGGQLSTGMRGRLKLAMAIQAEPDVLLLDEPGAGLDEGGRGVVHKIIEEQSLRGCVVLATNEQAERRFATHELELAS